MSTHCRGALPSGYRHGQAAPCPVAECVHTKQPKGKEKERKVNGAWESH